VIELLVQLMGYIGMVLILLTLLLTRKHFVKSQIVSFIGGILLTSNAYAQGPRAYPFLVLNFIWTLISIYNLWKAGRDKSVKATKA